MRVVPLAREQQATELAFDFLDGACQGRLADVALVRRAREIQRVADCEEIADVIIKSMQYKDS
jgi:hypothetical protein